METYSGYTAHIYEGEDVSIACDTGDDMKEAFPGAEYKTLKGKPLGHCSHVEGENHLVCILIQKWINGQISGANESTLGQAEVSPAAGGSLAGGTRD